MPEAISSGQASSVLELYKADPVFHIKEVQGVQTLEPYQEEICRTVAENERTAIAACHDVGKTFTLSKIVLWFCSTFEGAKIITTAPTFNQVKNLLWSEIRTGFNRSKYPLGGEMLTTAWKIADDWFAIGFTSKFEANAGEGQGTASTFQGFHGKYVMVIFDEATGINHQIWTQAEGLLTSANVKFVAIGNPTSRASEFFNCFRSGLWKNLHLNCFDSPNLKANGIKNMKDLANELEALKELPDAKRLARLKSYKVVSEKLLTLAWVMRAALKWGLSHPLFVSKVLGEFPEEDDSIKIKLSTVEKAQARWDNLTAPKEPTHRSIGVDPARFGSDFTVITVIEDGYQTLHKRISKFKTTEVSGELINLCKSLPRARNEVLLVDGTGLGGGVVDELKEAQTLRQLSSNILVKEIQFGAACETEEDKKHYANLKAKIFDQLAKDMEDNLAVRPESVYQEQLPTIIYKFTSKGQLIIESKQDYKKRTGLPSPDDADSLAIANYGRGPGVSSGRFLDTMKPTSQSKGGGKMQW